MTVSGIPNLNTQVVTRPVTPAKAEGLQDIARVQADTVETSSSSKKGTDLGNGISTTVGGMMGLGMIIPGLYAGVLGGAVVGSLLGAGVGPALASITSHGALGFLSTSWQTAGVAARAGMFLGGASGLVGGWKAGTGVGHAIGRAFGAAKEESKDEQPVEMTGARKVLASVVAGGGLASGAMGGGILGASVAASGSILKGLAGHGFSMAALSGAGSAAMIGGAVGLATFGVLGGVGGFSIAKSAVKAGNWVYDKVAGAVKQPEPPKQEKTPETKTN